MSELQDLREKIKQHEKDAAEALKAGDMDRNTTILKVLVPLYETQLWLSKEAAAGAGTLPPRDATQPVSGAADTVVITCNPSALVSQEAWSNMLAAPGLTPLLNYRRTQRRQGGAPPLPLSLVDPVVGAIKAAFQFEGQEHSAPPGRDECEVVVKLLAMADAFSDEVARRAAFIQVLGDYLLPDRLLPAAVGDTKCSTDGHMISRSFPIYIQEVKNEIGVSGDPYFQGQRYHQMFLQYLADKPTVFAHACPCLLLELVGPHLRVSIMASVQDVQVLCEPLTPYLHVFDMLLSDMPHMQLLAKALRSLKWSVRQLNELYPQWAEETPQARPAKQPRREGSAGQSMAAAQASSSPDAAGVSRDPALQLPYPLRRGFRGPSGQPGTLPEQLPSNRPRQLLLYRCTAAEAPSQRLLVKFVCCGMYGAEVHKAWASAGLAPAYLSSERLPGGIYMAVMEELSAAEGWANFAVLTKPQREQWSGSVLAALRRGHKVAVREGKCAVHCDMRPANVAIRMPRPPQHGLGPEEACSSGSGAGSATAGVVEGETGGATAGSKGQGAREEPRPGNVEVRFLDFDWAALEGEAVLPPFARGRCGNASGERVTQQYDEDSWKETFLTDGAASTA